jgi:hypothetical protein
MIARQGSVSGSLDGCTINAANDRILRVTALIQDCQTNSAWIKQCGAALLFFFSSRG